MSGNIPNGSSSSSPSTPSSSVPSSPLSASTSLTSQSTQHLSPKDISQEDRQAAADLKQRANNAFASQEYTAAAHLYGEAIEHNPCDATLFCNRAYARMKIEEYGYAISDCSKAIELDPNYVKAYYRRALCHVQVLKPKLAVADFKKLLALEPSNALARSQLDTTQKLIRRTEFEKAIELEEEKDAVERCKEIIADDACQVDKSYTGPHLPTVPSDGKAKTAYTISLQFIRDMLAWFKEGKSLPKRYVWEIAIGAYECLVKEESMVEVRVEEGMTFDVVGDVHGQFYDYLHLLELTGEPSETHCLLMNGDLVDRGSWSIEVIVTALAFKWLYPNRMFINRGNHETKDMNRQYGFEGEARHKHGEQTYKLFAHIFTALPLATLISPTQPPVSPPSPSPQPNPPILSEEGKKRYFVVHGGLFSKDGVTLDEIRKIPRLGRQPGQEGLMCELLWTDPQDLPGRGPSKRGVGIAFGPDVTKRWCELNKVTGIFRSHEVRQAGYTIEHEGLCTTVFSAPNYVDQSGNKGAFVRIDAAGSCEYKQFEARPHPPLRPMAYAQGGLASMFM
ncbi:PPT1 [Sanghuangporus vaninii]